jgi:phage shock protein PspC (stress-responsive transcriptional regulator)
MVFEKLSKEKELDQLKIIKILKEVWEPEIIFSDYLDEDGKNNKKEDKELFFEKLLRNWWSRDNKNAWVLWISDPLANKVWIQVSLMRIILVLLISVWWVSIWLYIIAWIIMPLKWKNYSKMDTLGYFKYQIIKAIKDWAYNISGIILVILKYISSKSGKIIKFFFKNIFPVFRFIICFLIALVFLSLLFALLVIWAMYFTSFSIENIDFTSVLPYYFIYWIITWIIALAIMSISNFVYAISWKNINSSILTTWWISLLLAIFFWLATWFDLVEKYSVQNTFDQETEIDLWQNWSWKIDINILKDEKFGIMWWIYRIKQIELKNISWSILKVKVKNTIYWNDEIKNQVFSWLSNFTIWKENNNINLNQDNNSNFNKKIPFTFFDRVLTIYIPEWYNFKINLPYNIYISNTSLNSKYAKYNLLWHENCDNKEISFQKNEEKFVCDINNEDLVDAKKQLYQQYIIDNFDSISPVKHKKRYKREYINDDWYNADWEFYDFNYIDTWSLDFTFEDRSLSIYANVKLEETETWILVNDFKIDDIKVNKEVFEEKYYEDINPIKEFVN